MKPGKEERAEREPGPEDKSASGIVAKRARNRFTGVVAMLDEAIEFPGEGLTQEALKHAMRGAFELEQALKAGGAA